MKLAAIEEQEESFLKWLRQKQDQYSWLGNASVEFLQDYPNKTINVCPDGPKILVLPNASDVIYCYTREQWIDKLWLDIRLRPFQYPIIILNFLIFLFGATGNVFVCLSVYKNYQLRNVTNYFIVNLAFADLLVIIICLPATVVWDLSLTWFFGTLPCKLIMFLQDVSISVSVLTLAAISIDRYYAICHPLKFKSNLSQAKRMIALIWIISLLIMMPDVIYLHAKQADDLAEAGLDTVLYSDCNYHWSEASSKLFQFVKTILLYLLPFILMFCAHFKIMRTLQRASNMEQSQEKHLNLTADAEADDFRGVTESLNLVCKKQQQQQQQNGSRDIIELAPRDSVALSRTVSERKSTVGNQTNSNIRPHRIVRRYRRQIIDFRIASLEDKNNRQDAAARNNQPDNRATSVGINMEPDGSGQLSSSVPGSPFESASEKQTGFGGGTENNEPEGLNHFKEKNNNACCMAEKDNLFLIKTTHNYIVTPSATKHPARCGRPATGRARRLLKMSMTLGGSLSSEEASTPTSGRLSGARMSSQWSSEQEARAGSCKIPRGGSRWKNRLKKHEDRSLNSPNQSLELSTSGFCAAGSGGQSDLKVTMHNKTKLESRRKAAKMLMAIVVMFGICYLPVHLINFLRQFIDDIPQTDVTSTISMLAHCVCYLNSAINPIIYNHMNSIFRAEFSKFLSCLYCCRRATSRSQELGKLPAMSNLAHRTSINDFGKQQTDELRPNQNQTCDSTTTSTQLVDGIRDHKQPGHVGSTLEAHWPGRGLLEQPGAV